jgi:hypothetical protein
VRPPDDTATPGVDRPPVPITWLVEHLRQLGVSIDLDHRAARPVLVLTPAPPPELIGDLIDATPWLLHVALGRYTGHALAVCDTCAEPSMLAVRTPSGATLGQPGPQGGKPAPWPACLDERCRGRRRISDADREGVAVDRRPPAIPRAPRPEPAPGLPWPTDPTYRGG